VVPDWPPPDSEVVSVMGVPEDVGVGAEGDIGVVVEDPADIAITGEMGLALGVLVVIPDGVTVSLG
jgi:hypothetical protein